MLVAFTSIYVFGLLLKYYYTEDMEDISFLSLNKYYISEIHFVSSDS